jgi:hypothetical protein
MTQMPDTEGFGPRTRTHEEFAKPTVDDKELSSNNFGAGYYRGAEVYDQTQRFKQAINAKAGVGQDITHLAMGETFKALARSGWEVAVDDDTHEYPSLNTAKGHQQETEYHEVATEARESTDRDHQAELEYGRRLFMEMPDHLQEYALMELSSIDERFDPPEMRVTKFFHEATRSKGGRLMDNVFGRVRKMIREGVETADTGGLFSRRNRGEKP